ncbi:MAG: EF-Tu/IF-2/RF-3 family GTPase, partial [Solirubrobacterales bacterium]
GRIATNAEARLVREGTVIWSGRIASLRRFKDDVREVEEGQECGITLDGFQDVKVGDIVEAFETTQVEKKLE